jgi:hypothetical protein
MKSFAQDGFRKFLSVRTARREFLGLRSFLEQCHKNGDTFLSHILRVTGGETWVSFVNTETKEQSKQWSTHVHQRSRKTLNKTLSARNLMETVFWDRKGVK